MKNIIFIAILTIGINICFAQETRVEIEHTHTVDCNSDATNPQCMELWDILESLS